MLREEQREHLRWLVGKDGCVSPDGLYYIDKPLTIKTSIFWRGLA